MEIVVKNIGKVKEANIKINGITVIAGENDTGKSTISKALFTVFNSFYNINDKVKQQRKRSIENIINKHTVNEIDFDENFFEKLKADGKRFFCISSMLKLPKPAIFKS